MKRGVKRAARLGGLVAIVLAALAAAGWLASLQKDRHVGLGRVGGGVVKGQLEVIVASSPMVWTGQGWQFPTRARVVVGPIRTWWPSHVPVKMAIGMPGAMTTYTMTAVYVPLFMVVPALVGLGGGVLWVGRRGAKPGHCAGCGYDLTGLAGDRCPECGREGLVAKVLALLTGRGRQRIGVVC